MAMSSETKAEVIAAWNAGSSGPQIVKALGGRYRLPQVMYVVQAAQAKGLAALRRGADALQETRATLQLTLDPATWAWLSGLAAEAGLQGDLRGPAALAASILSEVARDDAAAERARERPADHPSPRPTRDAATGDRPGFDHED